MAGKREYPKLDGDVHYASEATDDYYGRSPVDSVTSWLKTGVSVSPGTANSDVIDKLVNSGATFQSDGVVAGMIIHNTTNDTYGIVETVDSETEITIEADTQAGSTVTDVFPNGNEGYTIYATPKLNLNWYECNGQTISDPESHWDGKVLPDMNNATQVFLRGANSSGGTGGSDTKNLQHNHTWITSGSIRGIEISTAQELKTFDSAGNSKEFSAQGNLQTPPFYTNKQLTTSQDILPSYYDIVRIIRIK